MYQIKVIPSDFVVIEEPINFSLGPYSIIKVTKTNYNTETVARRLAEFLKIPRKTIGYAGAKDKHAITTQYFSILNLNEKQLTNFKDPNIQLELVGHLDKPLTLGDLKGNFFQITIRNLKQTHKPETITKTIKNYYGPQRFGKHNAEIGNCLIKKDFKTALKLINDNSEMIFASRDYVGMLEKIPRHTLMIYLHAYQSKLWNRALSKLTHPTEYLPLVGFGTELEEFPEDVKTIYEQILKEENITTRDFIIKQLRGLSPEGDLRKSLITTEIKIYEAEEDDLNLNMKKQKIEFKLPKGSYATVIVEDLFF